MRWIVCLLAVLIVAAPVGAQQPPPARVAVTKIFEKELSPTTTLVGVVDFDHSAGLSAEISGLLAEHQMVEGLVVRQGEVLARLNTDFILKDIAVADQAVFQSPGGGQHLLAWKRFGIRRDGAGDRTGGALKALFYILSAKLTDFFDIPDIRFD
jgi:hypothetical protein